LKREIPPACLGSGRIVVSFFNHGQVFFNQKKETSMLKDPLVKVPYHFPGITVLVPGQPGGELVAVNKGSLIPDHIPVVTPYFRWIRHIANIVLLRRADYEEGIMNPVQTFDPPIEFHVGYNFHDIMKSNGDYLQLKLAYWDGREWVIFNEPTHEYHILPPSTGQVAGAKIWSWVGDPMVAWGA
jgi:hypothetical protein